MDEENNYIFDKLVEDKQHLQGQIAYTLYKYEKIEWMDKFEKKHGRKPNEDEKKEYREICCINERIEGYKIQAEKLLFDFSNNLWNIFTDETEKDYLEDQDEHIKDALQSILPSKRRQFWMGVAQSIGGAVATSILVWLFSSIVGQFEIGKLKVSYGDEDTKEIKLIVPKSISDEKTLNLIEQAE